MNINNSTGRENNVGYEGIKTDFLKSVKNVGSRNIRILQCLVNGKIKAGMKNEQYINLL